MELGRMEDGSEVVSSPETHGRESDGGYISTVRFPFFWLLEGQPCLASFISLGMLGCEQILSPCGRDVG